MRYFIVTHTHIHDLRISKLIFQEVYFFSKLKSMLDFFMYKLKTFKCILEFNYIYTKHIVFSLEKKSF